jgi:hypothetical protein
MGGVNSAWHVAAERRVYLLRQALANMIDRMNAADSMRIIAFSTGMPGNAEASSGWSADKIMLKTAVATLGGYAGDPYRTSGSASSAIALQKARDLLATAPAMAPSGQPYEQAIIMLTDSVANVFLDGTTNTARDICGNLAEQQALRTADPCQLGATKDGKLRPISAMIEVANSIKAEHPNIALYVVGLAHIDQTGLTQVASDPSLFYAASQPAQLEAVLSDIQSQSSGAICVPAGGYAWVASIDAEHLPGIPGLSDTVVGYTYIYPVNSATPLFTLPIRRDPTTDRISFRLPPPDASHPDAGIAPGTYEITAYAGYKGNDQISRLYDWLIDPNMVTGASRRIFTITPSGLGGPTVALEPLYLDLPPTAQVCP